MEIRCDCRPLDLFTAIHCALIVNELVSNCLKHAFPDGTTGEVTIALHRINGTYELTVADMVWGFPQIWTFGRPTRWYAARYHIS